MLDTYPKEQYIDTLSDKLKQQKQTSLQDMFIGIILKSYIFLEYISEWKSEYEW